MRSHGHHPLRPWVAFLTLLAFSACSTWQPFHPQPGAPLPDIVMVELVNADRVKVFDAAWEADSALVGHQLRRDGPEFRVGRQYVESIEESRVSWAITLLAVSAAGGFLALLGAAGAFDFEYGF